MLIPETPNTYEPAPAGTQKAILNRIVDMGTQETEFAGVSSTKRQVVFGFEIEGLKTANGNPVAISKTMTFSLNSKATLNQYAEALLNRAITDTDRYGKERLDAAVLLGKGCLLSITHAPKPDGGVSARVTGIIALPSGTKVGKPVNAPEILSLTEGAFDPAVYDKQPSWIKDKVSRSPEYRELLKPKTDPLIGKVKAKKSTAEVIDDDLPDDWK